MATLQVFNKSKSFQPELLTIARESRGLTQEDLAFKADLLQNHVSRLEKGNVSCSNEVLESISRVLNFPETFFFQESVFASGISYHRKRNNFSKKIQLMVDSRIKIFQLSILSLLNKVDVEAYELPYFSLKENSPESISRLIRQNLDIERGPINEIIPILEELGIFIWFFDFETEHIDGVSVLNDK